MNQPVAVLRMQSVVGSQMNKGFARVLGAKRR
jgi:hypothetical protein